MRVVLDPRQLPSAAGAAVMATGIVSLALAFDGQRLPSTLLAALTGAIWAVLLGMFVLELVRDPAHLRARVSDPAALTAVAATAVLAARLGSAGARLFEAGLALAAALVWPALTLAVWRAHRRGAADGTLLLLSVAPGALAAVAGGVATAYRHQWPALVGLVPLLAAFGFYVLVVARLPLDMLRFGGGDMWIAGGAPALMALACAQDARAFAGDGLEALGSVLRVLDGVWVAVALVWLVALLFAEIRWPRLRYDVRRWATAFPVGMYAAMAFASAQALGVTALERLARVWVWVALGAWLVIAAAGLKAATRR